MPKLSQLITLLKKKRLLLVITLLFFSTNGYCQQFYVCTANGFLNLVTVTPNGPVSQSVQGCGDYSYYSIAILGSKIFYNTPGGNLYSGDITGTNPQTITNCTSIASGVSGNALTVDSQGVLYYVNYDQLYAIDPKNPTPVLLGQMPYSSGGDLVFYKNQLYMAANGGIVKVSISDPSQSSMYIPLQQGLYGLTVVDVNGTKIVYALTGGGAGTDLLQLDMENRTVLQDVGSLPYTAYDAGSNSESAVVAPPVKVNSTSINQECNVFNAAQVVFNCDPHTSTYTFTLNTGQSNTTGVFDDLSPGNYQVAIVSDGIETQITVPFTVPDYTTGNPVLTATLTDPVCNVPGQIKLDAGADNTSYKISYNNSVYGFDHIFTGLTAGSYHFTILKASGCIADEKDYALKQDICPPIVVTDIGIQAECDAFGLAQVQVITQPHPEVYTYTLNNISNTTGVFDLLKPGVYTLLINAAGGGQLQQQITVPDFTLNRPQVSYVVKNADCELPGGVTFTIAADNSVSDKIKDGNEVYQLGKLIGGVPAGNNSFAVLNQQGCIIDTLSVYVPLDVCIPVVFPNTFTPNGDGVNDIFRANQNSDPLDFRLTIYNRWGALIFQSSSVFNGWDGIYNRKPVPQGVYYWVATYALQTGKRVKQAGYVTLIR